MEREPAAAAPVSCLPEKLILCRWRLAYLLSRHWKAPVIVQ
jgi:hypothetical protein